MRNLRLNTMLAGLALVSTFTLTTGCDESGSGEEYPACYADLDVSDDDPGTPYYASAYDGDASAAEAACEAAVNAGGDADADTDTDADTDSDVDDAVDGDPETGAENVSIEVDGVIMTWITNDGVRVCIEKSRVAWDVSPETTWTVGYGWGGSYDWTTLSHGADQYRYDGVLYVCPVSALVPMDDNGLFVQNFTRGQTGVTDYTNWARVFEGDKYACVTGQTSSGAPTYALAYSIQYDRDSYWRVQSSTSGACQLATDG